MRTFVTKLNLTLLEAAFLLLLVIATPALAADATITIPLASWGDGLKTLLGDLIGVGAALLIGALGVWVRKTFGITWDNGLQARAISMATQGAKQILAALPSVKDFDMRVGNPVIADVANEIIAEVPNIAAHRGITEASLVDWVSKHIVAALGELTKLEPDAPGPIPQDGTDLTTASVTISGATAT